MVWDLKLPKTNEVRLTKNIFKDIIRSWDLAPTLSLPSSIWE